MFDNVFDSNLNGEIRFFESIKDECEIIFDVGSHNNSIFVNYDKCVHYFEHHPKLMNELKNLNNLNKESYFNEFGLSDVPQKLKYYNNLGSFVDRSEGPSKCESVYIGEDFLLKRGCDYMTELDIFNIDFLKIDVECMELQVLKGFNDKLKNVKYIQFEYGIGTADGGYKLLDLINYLKQYEFNKFYYISKTDLVEITDYTDHWNYCNIICKK